jgi:hypothetical protein
MLKTVSEWWYQSKESVTESVKKQRFYESDSSDSYGSDYLSDTDDDFSSSSEKAISSISFPIFGKKTYCGVDIKPQTFSRRRPSKPVDEDSDAFSNMSQMLANFEVCNESKGQVKSNSMLIQSVDSDYNTCYIQYLSLFTFISVFLFEGDIYFQLQKYNQCFIFSFFEWSLIMENRKKLIHAVKNNTQWMVRDINYHDYVEPWHHTFNSLRYNGKRLNISVLLDSGVIDNSDDCNSYDSDCFSSLRGDMSENIRFTLNKTELKNLVFAQTTPFMLCVQNLVESRFALNIVSVAICNVINKMYLSNQDSENQTSDMSFEAFVCFLSNLFSVHNYHAMVQLRIEVDLIYNRIQILYGKTHRDLQSHVSIQDLLPVIFPSQIVFLKKIYDRTYCDPARRAEETFSCKQPHCINPICFDNVCKSIPY